MAVESPQRTEIDRPAPGDAPARAEELIIKEARRRHRLRLLSTAGIATAVIVGVAIGVVILAGHRSSGRMASPLPTDPGHLTPSGSRCQSGQLKVTSLFDGAGMGQVTDMLEFQNVSEASCTLVGFPTVLGLDASGNPVATAQPTLNTIDTGATAPPTVTLGSGKSASATIWGRDGWPSDPPISCPSYSAFLVTPPGWTRSVNVPSWVGGELGPFPACQTFSITPVVPLDSGSLPVRIPIRSINGRPPATIPGRGVPTATTIP